MIRVAALVVRIEFRVTVPSQDFIEDNIGISLRETCS